MKNFPNSLENDFLFKGEGKYVTIWASTAFTLMELIAVTGIVMVLVLVAMPAIFRVREAASAAHCVSNLRQLQQANMNFARSHDGQFVPVFANGSETAAVGRVLWTGNADFINFLGINRTSSITSTSELLKAWPRKLICPEAKIDRGRIDRSYAYNRTGLGALYSKPGVTAAVRAAEISRPSQVIAFIDSLNWMIDYNSTLGEYTGEVSIAGDTVAYRHAGKAHAVFFDGHVESLSKNQVMENPELWIIKHQ